MPDLDDLYQASYAHEQKEQWAQSMSMAMMANKKTLFVTLVDLAKPFKAHLHRFQLIGYFKKLLRHLDINITARSHNTV